MSVSGEELITTQVIITNTGRTQYAQGRYPHHTTPGVNGKASIFQVGLGFGKIGDVENAFGENLESI